jgi:hypothetical protein
LQSRRATWRKHCSSRCRQRSRRQRRGSSKLW